MSSRPLAVHYSLILRALANQFAGLNPKLTREDAGRVAKCSGSYEFNDTTSPDVKDKSRLLPICGTPSSSKLADLTIDGWFY